MRCVRRRHLEEMLLGEPRLESLSGSPRARIRDGPGCPSRRHRRGSSAPRGALRSTGTRRNERLPQQPVIRRGGVTHGVFTDARHGKGHVVVFSSHQWAGRAAGLVDLRPHNHRGPGGNRLASGALGFSRQWRCCASWCLRRGGCTARCFRRQALCQGEQIGCAVSSGATDFQPRDESISDIRVEL